MALELPDVQSKLGAEPERGNGVFLFQTAKTLNRESYFAPSLSFLQILDLILQARSQIKQESPSCGNEILQIMFYSSVFSHLSQFFTMLAHADKKKLKIM